MRPGGTDAASRIGFLAFALVACGAPEATVAPPPPVASVIAESVGTARCVACHPEPARAWRGSHHDRALEVAGPATVLGAFDGRTASGMGQSATFLREGDRFVVETTDEAGAAARFDVSWTFGVAPIQQYLTPGRGGAVQALPWLWDARAVEAGGQRWHALYPDEAIPPGDPLHWGGPNQRWNSMCAECHSTGVRGGYDATSRTWATTWTDEDVGCEACHGEGSRHAAWAEAGASGPDPGLPVDLVRRDVRWEMDPARGIARRLPARVEGVEVDTCGRCHGRRATLSEAPPSGRSLLDTHRPAVLEVGLYGADGQIEDEVYEWGSFVQSPMYAAGVTCSDCHDPHSGHLVRSGDALCGACHLPARFGAEGHRHHAVEVACVDCHMPERTYMVVDGRRDHSMRVPRPDLAAAVGVREPCTGCHADRDAAWAAEAVRAWFPDGRTGTPHYALALHAGRTRAPDAPDRLEALAADPRVPAIARATAVSLLPQYPRPSLQAAVATASRDADPIVRREAATAAGALSDVDRARIVGPLLDDDVLGVRLAAAEGLAGVPRAVLADGGARCDAVIWEVRAAHALHLDRPEAWAALGDLDRALGDPVAAEASYREALALDPRAVAARVNLSDLLGAVGRDREGLSLLVEGIARDPEVAGLHHAAGLARVRLGDPSAALADLERAAVLAPDEPRYAFVYAVALSSAGRVADAERVAEGAADRVPGDPDLLAFLEGVASARGDVESARAWRERARREAPWAFPDR